MKNYLFLVCLFASTHAAFVSAADARIPEPVMQKIKSRAASDFPSNKSAQQRYYQGADRRLRPHQQLQ
jgi:hypothetical protein